MTPSRKRSKPSSGHIRSLDKDSSIGDTSLSIDDRLLIEQALADDPSLIARISSRQFSGPMPPPEMLAEYEKVLPGFADRILRFQEQVIKEAEAQRIHRHSMERLQVEGSEKRQSLAQIFGAIIAITSLIVSGYTLATVQYIPAVFGAIFIVAIGIGGVTVARLLVKNTKSSTSIKDKIL